MICRRQWQGSSNVSSWGDVQVGISSVWYEGNPCNMHLLELADHVKQGVKAAGMVGYRYTSLVNPARIANFLK